MAITALPTPPSRADSSTFAARADTFLAALTTFVVEANALQVDVNTRQTAAGTSATNASGSATAAGNSATAAGTSATAASGSATAASGSATAAGTSATNASTSASTASTKAGEAATSAANAAAVLANAVQRTSATGSALIPTGTTAQRDASPAYGAQRANSTINQQEWWNGTAWVPMGGGATGAPGNSVFFENDKTVTANYTITTGKNAISGGPITIADGVSVTIPTGSTWSIV